MSVNLSSFINGVVSQKRPQISPEGALLRIEHRAPFRPGMRLMDRRRLHPMTALQPVLGTLDPTGRHTAVLVRFTYVGDLGVGRMARRH